jgi:putative heme iron utilization protein
MASSEPLGGLAPALAARRLLRAARAGTLATVSPAEDAFQPFASLVTPAIAADGAILLLLSDLAEHTRHLRAEPRCSVLVVGTPETANRQTAPRVSVTGIAEVSGSAANRARYLAVHPYAAAYEGFGDFHLWRVVPRGGLLVGGFGRANRLRAAELVPPVQSAAAIAAAEPSILSHCNNDHADALALIGAAASRRPGPWRMAAVDPEGFDLALDETTWRIDFSVSVADSDGVRNELARLTRALRQNAETDDKRLDRPAVSP